MTRTLGHVAWFVVLLAGCSKGDAVPTYIVIPSVSVSANEAQGGGTSKITDVWVAVDDKAAGVWELPARVPVLGSGPSTITVTPAVKRNGAFDDRLRYPYYRAFNQEVELIAERSVELTPVVTYVDAADFWLELFNDAGDRLTVAEDSDTTLLLYTAGSNPEVLLDGSSCKGFALETGRPYFHAYTTEDFLPANGPAYIELDYSTDVTLTIGFTYLQDGFVRNEPWAVLVPTTAQGGVKWNKVYIDVTSFFNVSGISERDIYIAASLPSSQGTGHVYMDNLKLIRSAS